MKMCRSSALLLLAWCEVTQGQENPSATCGMKGDDNTPWTRRDSRDNRIVNGQKASPGEWKWQVSLREGGHFCGGTLIADLWVFTAAHCIEDSPILNGQGNMEVVTGDYKRISDRDEHARTYAIEQGWMHPSYDSSSMEYDFALIKLQTPVELNAYTGYACLPEAALEPGVECWTTGWGTRSSGGTSPNALMEAPLTIWTNSKCDSAAHYNGEISDTMICAQGISGSEFTDACQGDSGGPLVCQDSNDKWVLHGATSWGYGCAEEKYPGIYSRVHYVMDWVTALLDGIEYTTTPMPLPPFPDGQMWLVQEGPCDFTEDGCITSPRYDRGKNYNKRGCLIRVKEDLAVLVSAVDFKTERSYDWLIVNGVGYSGNVGPDSVTPQDPIVWKPDDSVVKRGWKLCPDTSCTPITSRWKSNQCVNKCDGDTCHNACPSRCSASCGCNFQAIITTTLAPTTCTTVSGWNNNKCSNKCDGSRCHSRCSQKCSSACSCNDDRRLSQDILV